MVQGKITDGDVTELVRSTADAASAYIRGDIQRYLTLIKHGDNYTLMAPYGGEPRRGFDVKEALETTPRMFRGGEADMESSWRPGPGCGPATSRTGGGQSPVT
jgi:hypothetical protein